MVLARPNIHTGALPQARRYTYSSKLRAMAISVHRWDESTQEMHATPSMKSCFMQSTNRLPDVDTGPPTRKKVLEQLRQEGYSTTTYTFSPGTVFGDHVHACQKKDAILSGKFLFRMGKEEVILEAGDMLDVPAGAVHYAEVVGNEPCGFVDASKN